MYIFFRSFKTHTSIAVNETVNHLLSIGFKVCCVEENGSVFMDSIKEDEYGLPVIQVYVYDGPLGRAFVNADEGYFMPVMNDDKHYMQEYFIDYLNMNFPGWR